MIYDWRSGELPRARLWDARGVEIHGMVFRLNTETGLVERYEDPCLNADVSNAKDVEEAYPIDRFVISLPCKIQFENY